jgi:LDH2 family malate/lactate/ureidoglycolate dehydrogenase
MYDDPQPQRVGHMFSAISVEAFMPMTEFLSRMDQKEQETRQGPPAPGFEQVLMPGDGTHERMATHREAGIPLTDEVYADLLAAAERYGVSPDTLESGRTSREGTQR